MTISYWRTPRLHYQSGRHYVATHPYDVVATSTHIRYNGDMHTRTILSLFDYSGRWSDPYLRAGYPVIQVDIKLGIDIMDFNPRAFFPIYGILAAPPCTDFSSSGARWWAQKDLDGRTRESLALIHRTLDIIDLCEPTWWALENPVGRLNKLIPALVPHGPWYFQPWWYGDPYTKKTGLWGTFNNDLPESRVEPIKACAQGSWVQRLGGKSERTKELRSITPTGFARAFFAANP